jgi:hypothetical protein
MRRFYFCSGTAMLSMVSVIIFSGCVGYVDGGGGGAVYVAPPEPNVVVFGGDYDRGHDVHTYSHRGYESRQEVHHDNDHGHHWW